VSISGLLTKKFVNLIKQAEDGVLDLNKAADTLHVGTYPFTYGLQCLLLSVTLSRDSSQAQVAKLSGKSLKVSGVVVIAPLQVQRVFF